MPRTPYTGDHHKLRSTVRACHHEPEPIGRAKSAGDGRAQAARRLRRRSASRMRRRTSRPMRCRLAASIDNATVCANPSAPWERTRSRPRCSRLLIADSTAGCWRLASANACACSRSRSATESRPLRGSALSPPQLHPRTPHVAIGARQNVLLQQREKLLAGLLMRIQMLETKENGWNVIAGFMIQLDVLDPCLTECELRFPCLSHWCPSCEDCRQWADWGGNSCINYLTSKFFAQS